MFNHNPKVNRAGAAMARAFQQAAEALIEQQESNTVFEPRHLGLKRFTFGGTRLGQVMLARGFNQPRIAVTNGQIALDIRDSEKHDQWLDTTADVRNSAGASWEKETLGINPGIIDQHGWPILRWVGEGEITITQKPTDPLGPILIQNQDILVSAVVMPCRLA